MSNLSDRSMFESAYLGLAPWDIGRPQPAILEVASKIQGSVLDVGCGSGENALFLASRGNKVTGIDFVEEAIFRANKKAADRSLEATFFVMDALALKDLPEVFDSAIDSGLFHVIQESERLTYVEGLTSVVKPGGKLFLLCFSEEEPGTQGPRRVNQAEIRQAFSRGWVVESISSTRFAVIPEMDGTMFSSGGPKAWFAVLRRQT